MQDHLKGEDTETWSILEETVDKVTFLFVFLHLHPSIVVPLSLQRPDMETQYIDCVATCVWTAPVSLRQTPSN